jgi:hypothetical protein
MALELVSTYTLSLSLMELSHLSEGHTTLVSTICSNLGHDASTTSAFTEHSNTIRVATKLGNVLLDPLKSEALIMETSVRSSVFLESWTGQPAERAKSVVERNIDHAVVVFAILATSEQTSGVITTSFGAGCVATTIDPDKHSSALALLSLLLEDLLRDDNIKEEAVLGRARVDCRDDGSVESIEIDVVYSNAGRNSKIEFRLVELPDTSKVAYEEFLGNKAPKRVRLRANGLAPVELNSRTILGWRLRSVESVLARRRRSVADIGEAVQSSRVVERVGTVDFVSKIDLWQLVVLCRSCESDGWQQSCQRRNASRDPHCSRVECAVSTIKDEVSAQVRRSKAIQCNVTATATTTDKNTL